MNVWLYAQLLKQIFFHVLLGFTWFHFPSQVAFSSATSQVFNIILAMFDHHLEQIIRLQDSYQVFETQQYKVDSVWMENSMAQS